jgi:leucyl/phenylalanyl-tRNA---protein transferase
MNTGFGPDELLDCYRRGVFPMADGRDDPRLFLVDPEQRGVLPLERFHVPKRLARTVRSDVYRITVDQAFRDVLEACAAPHELRPETWINQPILELYDALFRRKMAHSVECWQGDTLVGGLYGVRIGAAFFGESMFSRARDASKVALVHLVGHLTAGGFSLLDTQFLTAHLEQFGTQEIARATYKERLDVAINSPSTFPVVGLLVEGLPEELQAQHHLPAQQHQEVTSPLGPGARCLLAIAAAAQPRHCPHN